MSKLRADSLKSREKADFEARRLIECAEAKSVAGYFLKQTWIDAKVMENVLQKLAVEIYLIHKIEWLGTGSNRRPHDFQSHARTN